ncbi:ROK family protein [Pigmentiphaga sp.]|jgi:Transcriptional regulator/sugar kinase|uniref:ROK family protein n=1 Tax=Pigmentiphaga sp. TaxID=1977564 RepID=UPI0025E9F331|nr:ROK family protein [Pigmentiphaga sp.]MBX6318238.1 ROK family protein [Pigmentiphaga sp.]
MTAGILSIDIGGSGLKAAVIDDEGKRISKRVRVPTPRPCPPGLLVEKVARMVAKLEGYDRVSIGFPGMIRNQRVLTAVNLHSDEWAGFPLAEVLGERLGCPARMINDADMQGYGLVRGVGLEFVMTLGTGVGTALFRDGKLMPHMELAHHPIEGRKTYEDYLGAAALLAVGEAQWNRRLRKALGLIDILLRPDHVFLGGGNARKVTIELPPNVTVGSNAAGISGGAALWRDWDSVRS